MHSQYQDKMTDDINTRLSRASEAWARLFQSSIPVNQAPNNSTQHNNNANTTISLSEENLRANNHWGDALAEKGESTTRIYIQNVNGVKLHRDGGQFSELCSIVKETQADILCIQEHNLDTTQYHVRNTLYTTTRHHWSRSKLTIASSPIQFENMWKPGGTAIMSVGSITGRIKGQGTDAWGRWSHQTFQGSGGRLITIISVYQVVEKHLTQTKGQYTAAAQQRSLSSRQSDTLQTPRQAFRRDLTEFIQTQIRTGHLIVLTGDFNECIGERIQMGFQRLLHNSS
jgi:exonuclease III